MKEKFCYMCGSSSGLTKHHAIPQCMDPVKNMIIPLCGKCHKKFNMDTGANSVSRREIVYFMKVMKNGKEKVQGNISNGKVIFPDFSEKIKVKPDRYYDCLVHQTHNVAFARDIKEYNKVI